MRWISLPWQESGSRSYTYWGATVVCLVVLLILSLPALGEQNREGSQRKGPVTLVVINRLALDDIAGEISPHIQALANQGAIGLMNTRTGGGLTSENAFTTLGGGLRLVGAGEARIALPAEDDYHGQKAGAVYRRRTGEEAPQGSIVILDIESIKANNLASIGTDRVGTIGEALGQAAKVAAVVGNADYGNEYQRWAALIAMNAKGWVPVGQIGSSLYRVDPAFPTGYRTDLDNLWNAYLTIRPKADFIVVDLGDMDRVEVEKKQLSPELYQKYRQEVVATADRLIERLLETVDLKKEWVLVVSPIPASHGVAKGELMTPLIVAGPGLAPGLLTSSTTRRAGVVTNYDIAPSVIAWLNLPRPRSLPGACLTNASGRLADYGLLKDILRRSAVTYQQRPSLLKAFVSLEIIVYLTVFGLVVIFANLPRGWISVLGFMLLLIAAIPLALLLLPLLPSNSLATGFLYALVTGFFVTGLAWHLVSDTEARYAIICGATALGLLLDVLTGSSLIRLSPLGYDVMLGARFYGIGNEYMGILVGSSLLAALSIRDRRPKGAPGAFLWLITVIYVLASPRLGANAGGTITVAIAFPLAWGLQGCEKPSRIVLALGAVLMVAFLVNLLPSVGVGSHVGRAIRTAMAGNWSEIWQIGQRKLIMNWKLMRYSIWSKGLLVALGVMAVLIYRPTPVVQTILEEHPAVRQIAFSTIVASIAALVFNDSGVVAGGTTSVYAAGLILSLVLEQREKTEMGDI